VAGLSSFFIFILKPGFEQIGFFLLCLVVLTSCLLSVRFLRTERINIVAALFTFSFCFAGFVLPLLYQNVMMILVLVYMVVLVSLSSSSIPQAVFLRLMILGGGVFIVSGLIDYLGIPTRPIVLSPYLENFLFGIILIFFAVVLIRQFPISSIRYKVVVSFLVITLFLVVVIGGYSLSAIRKNLIDSGSRSLHLAAGQVVNILDNFFAMNLQVIDTEAKLLARGYSLQSTQGEVFLDRSFDFNAELQALKAEKEQDISDPGWFAFVKGYQLLSEAGEIIETVPDSLDIADLPRNISFQTDLSKIDLYYSPVFFTPEGEAELYFLSKFILPDVDQTFLLVLIYDARVIQKIIQQENNLVGERSMAWVIDDNGLILARGINEDSAHRFISDLDEASSSSLQEASRIPETAQRYPMVKQQSLLDGWNAIRSSDASSFTFAESLLGEQQQYWASGMKMRSQPWSVIYSQQENYFLSPVHSQVRNLQILAGIMALVIIVVSIGFSNFLTSPIVSIARVATQVASGDLKARAHVNTQDEIGNLAVLFNTMTEKLQRSFSEMEERVNQRTFDLERRSRQLQLAADVGRAAAKMHDLHELLTSATKLISERFNHYHVGIFLVDEAGEYIVLRAANSEDGKRMVADGYRLAIGYQGVVGEVAATGQAKIISGTDSEADKVGTPELPNSRSEFTLPLIASGELLGVLDIHSNKSNAFSTDDLPAMQILADLIAVAIENARLITEGQFALEATRRAYGEISQETWQQRMRGRGELAFRSQARSTYSISNAELENEQVSPQQISVPIKIRDTVVGYVDTYKPLNRGYWTVEEEETLNKLVEQIGIALESARLFENSQMQAEREKLVGEAIARMQENLDFNIVLRTAAREIRDLLGLRDVTILLADDSMNTFE
jgi:GAF domain-containing protein/HAMP domain-containing protein